ncbi:MAG: AEC family transporter [Pseudomonadota bacterium]
MDIFLDLLIKVLPLYFIILLGFIAGKRADIQLRQIADFAIYFINPVALFMMIWQADLSQADVFLLPLLAVVFMLLIGGGSYIYGQTIWGDSRKNLLAAQIMNGNSGYFGVPVAFALFSDSVAGVWILIMLAGMILQVSLGYYLIAVGTLSPLEGIKRLLRLPPFWAMVIGLLINLIGISWPVGLGDTYQIFKGAFIVLGMSIIGLSLARLSRAHFDVHYIAQALFWRFGIWPVMVFAFVLLDRQMLGWMDPQYYGLLLLFGTLPIAADSAAYAVQLDLYPERAASVILISTLIALVFIPAVMTLFML